MAEGLLPTLAVLARILSNPLSNVMQKQLAERDAEPVFVIAATHGLLTAAALPVLLALPAASVGPGFMGNMLISVVLAVAGNALLVAALRSTDLSVLGPINAYKAVVALALAVFLLGEVPTAAGLAGVALIVGGSYFVIDRAPGQLRRHALRQFVLDRGVQLRFAALACSATEAVFLKRAILVSSPLITFLVWVMAGFAVASTAAALRSSGIRRELARLVFERRRYLWLALTTGVMQLTTLLSFGRLQVGYSLALFQLSTLISVYLGHRYFQERNIRRRVIGASVMLTGAILIVTLGRRT